ncbi:MAG: type I DNA topoisomerase [Anaerohalosphaeraceae bacterium]|nr:type I DNA topoisomerase [Anaerohalosphaeraceae bacterium]
MAKTTRSKKPTCKNLVIVESPAKAKTINKYLGSDYHVEASMGHIRDLPSKGISVDIENGFEPTYEITAGRKKLVSTLKSLAKNCEMLYLATDLDREGEAIAWHLAQVLGVPEEKTQRVIFNSITKKSIQDAFANATTLDVDKVMAQQARRILDRIVGYQISPLLWKKVARGLSAGRVQSVAVKMVVEKEREIRAFVPIEYWLIPAVFTTEVASAEEYSQQWEKFISARDEKDKGPTLVKQNDWLAGRSGFKAELHSVDGEAFSTDNEKRAMEIYAGLSKADFSITDVQVKSSSSRPAAPFITSTLQQAASNKLGFATKRTMRVAQQLYEGIDMGSLGSLGLITYMRTDSTHLSGEALSDVRRHISNNVGQEYLPEKPNFFGSKKNAQQAHEAIRPTDCDIVPGDTLRGFLSEEQFKLYQIIWQRFVASQMTSAKWNTTTLEVTAETAAGKCCYRANGRVLVFDGFTRVWPVSSVEQVLPKVEVGDALGALDVKAQQHFTKPPARYNEASLVKALEKEGIGRPSTYASIISTIQDRRYVEQLERRFFATDIGEVVTEKLVEFFPRVLDMNFTRHMEEQLDKIEEQHLEWTSVLEEFYEPFRQNVEKATEDMKHAKAETKPSEYECPKCKKPMVYRFGKNGRFLSCSDYPKCKFACPCDREGVKLEEQVSEHKCPECGKPMIHKHSRFGEFLGCSGYPECKTTQKIDKEGNVLPPTPPAEPSGVKCYKCKEGELVIRQSKKGPFLGCNKFPRCRTIISMKQLDNLKQLQADGIWPPDTWEKADELLGRKKAGAKKKTTAKKKTAKKAVKKKRTSKKKTTVKKVAAKKKASSKIAVKED